MVEAEAEAAEEVKAEEKQGSPMLHRAASLDADNDGIHTPPPPPLSADVAAASPTESRLRRHSTPSMNVRPTRGSSVDGGVSSPGSSQNDSFRGGSVPGTPREVKGNGWSLPDAMSQEGDGGASEVAVDEAEEAMEEAPSVASAAEDEEVEALEAPVVVRNAASAREIMMSRRPSTPPPGRERPSTPQPGRQVVRSSQPPRRSCSARSLRR